jgi:hypothetical protein
MREGKVRRAPSGVSAYLTANVNWFCAGKRLAAACTGGKNFYFWLWLTLAEAIVQSQCWPAAATIGATSSSSR